jgi:hypothetical protein
MAHEYVGDVYNIDLNFFFSDAYERPRRSLPRNQPPSEADLAILDWRQNTSAILPVNIFCKFLEDCESSIPPHHHHHQKTHQSRQTT